MVRWAILAGCICGLFWGNVCSATDSVADSQAILNARHAHARELIHQRALQVSRSRQARIEARKRAGISLLRPAQPTRMQVSRGTR